MLPEICAFILNILGIVLERASNFFCGLDFNEWIYLLTGICALGFLMLRGFSDQLNR
jgi:hypothetical protein